MYCSIFNKTKGAARAVAVFALATLLLAGCATSSNKAASVVQFDATGDPGVELRMVVIRGGIKVADENYAVPTKIHLAEGDANVAFVHGGTAGNLTIKGSRNGLLVSIGSTGELGAVTEFKIRNHEISMKTMSASAAAASARF